MGEPLRRLAMISLHTSPLDQPGTGDAGGMNVYVIELAKRLVRRGVEVDVFTRATSSALESAVSPEAGITVRHIHAGPFEGLTKEELPAQLCVFAREVLRAEAAHPVGHYDAVHSHYWLSGQVGALARDRWGVPLVHSMHTMAKVKNDALADGDTPEPLARVIGEEQVVEAADMLIANTDLEAKQLIELYDADPGRVEVVHPGVDLDVFRPARGRRGPGRPRPADRRRRPPLRGPDPATEGARRAAARGGRDAPPGARSPQLARRAHRGRSVRLGARQAAGARRSRCRPRHRRHRPVRATGHAVRARPLVRRRDGGGGALLQRVLRAGRSEAQATGTPVVAAAVGGLTTVVQRRPQRPPRRRPRPTRLGHGADPGARRPRPARTPRGRRAEAGSTVLLGRHRRPDPRGLRAGRGRAPGARMIAPTS